jgi:hypothetical protein
MPLNMKNQEARPCHIQQMKAMQTVFTSEMHVRHRVFTPEMQGMHRLLSPESGLIPWRAPQKWKSKCVLVPTEKEHYCNAPISMLKITTCMVLTCTFLCKQNLIHTTCYTIFLMWILSGHQKSCPCKTNWQAIVGVPRHPHPVAVSNSTCANEIL